MLTRLKSLWRDEKGATAIEYGLIAALIAVAIVGVLALIGPKLSGTFQTMDDTATAPAVAESAQP